MSVRHSASAYVHVPLSAAAVVGHINASLLGYSSLLEQCSFSVLLDYAGTVLLQICLRMLERHCATTLLAGRSPFGPHWVSSLVVEGAPLQTWRAGCSRQRHLFLRSRGSRASRLRVAAHGLSCPPRVGPSWNRAGTRAPALAADSQHRPPGPCCRPRRF